MAGLGEPQDVCFALSQDSADDLSEAVFTPAPRGYSRPRVDTDNKRIRGDAAREEKRPGAHQVGILEPEAAELSIRRCTHGL